MENVFWINIIVGDFVKNFKICKYRKLMKVLGLELWKGVYKWKKKKV